MGSHIIHGFDHASTRPGLHLVTSQKTVTEQLLFGDAENNADKLQEDREVLGCVRGVAWAFGLQAALVAIVAGFWELCHLLR